MEHEQAFAKLVEALRPWLGEFMFIGGWAHRLHRLHRLANAPNHRPVVTRDADVVVPIGTRPSGNVGKALSSAGFVERFIGTDSPPVTHYELGEEQDGFYAEFLTSLRGDGRKRNGDHDVAVETAGVTLQKVRHLDVLLVEAWTVNFPIRPDAPSIPLRIPNATSFIVQRLLIHDKRKDDKKAQDILYIHDTLELFGGALDDLGSLWREHVRPSLSSKHAKAVVATANALFGDVTDTIRAAARIPQDRRISPESIRSACEYGLREVMNNTGSASS